MVVVLLPSHYSISQYSVLEYRYGSPTAYSPIPAHQKVCSTVVITTSSFYSSGYDSWRVWYKHSLQELPWKSLPEQWNSTEVIFSVLITR